MDKNEKNGFTESILKETTPASSDRTLKPANSEKLAGFIKHYCSTGKSGSSLIQISHKRSKNQ